MYVLPKPSDQWQIPKIPGSPLPQNWPKVPVAGLNQSLPVPPIPRIPRLIVADTTLFALISWLANPIIHNQDNCNLVWGNPLINDWFFLRNQACILPPPPTTPTILPNPFPEGGRCGGDGYYIALTTFWDCLFCYPGAEVTNTDGEFFDWQYCTLTTSFLGWDNIDTATFQYNYSSISNMPAGPQNISQQIQINLSEYSNPPITDINYMGGEVIHPNWIQVRSNYNDSGATNNLSFLYWLIKNDGAQWCNQSIEVYTTDFIAYVLEPVSNPAFVNLPTGRVAATCVEELEGLFSGNYIYSITYPIQFTHTRTQFIQLCRSSSISSPPYPQIPYPGTQEMADCCPLNTQLLKLINSKLGAFPANVPSSSLTQDGVQPTGVSQVNSIQDLLAWQAQRLDEIFGEFEISCTITNSDVPQGSQPINQTVRLPNLAEAVAEIYTVAVQSKIDNELILNLINLQLAEAASDKQQNFASYQILNAILDWLNIPTTQTTKEMQLAFTPAATTFQEQSQPTTIDVAVPTYTNSRSLLSDLHDLLHAASIIRAVFWRKLDPDPEKAQAQILADLKKMTNFGASDLGTLAAQIMNTYNSPTS